MIRRVLQTAAIVLALSTPAGAWAQSVFSEYDGAAATGLALRQLGNTARVLHIAAHPDDENTALFAPLALGRGAEAAYLSLTRGEGGQNGIGPELGVALGVIRTEELLAARRLDGADQFFTRAIDYGYSKNAAEAFRHWPKDTLLADVVAVIRQYRPDVVVSVWSGTPRDGHGQHEASGIIAREAVLAAADPDRFPEQIEAGLHPHTTALYYRSAWFSDEPDVELNTGELDPLLGASYHQIAMASRSRHRSQDQGRRLDPGPRRTAFDLVDPAAPVEVAETRRFGRYGEGAPETMTSLFEGVDTLLSQRADRLARLADPGSRGALQRTADTFREYERLVEQARQDLDPFAPWAIVPTLLQAQEQLQAAGTSLDALAFHAYEEWTDLHAALLAAANVEVDAIADEALVVPGQTFELTLSTWNGGAAPVRVVMSPLLPGPLTAELTEGEAAVTVGPGERRTATFAVTVGDAADFTMPYYLDPRTPEPTDLYEWHAPRLPITRGLVTRGQPFDEPPVRGLFMLRLGEGETEIPVDRDATRIDVDARDGEFRVPVKIVPAVSVRVEPEVAVLPLSSPDRPLSFTVRLRSQAPDGVTGEIRPVLPDGWSAEPAAVRVSLENAGADRTIPVEITPAPGTGAGAYEIGFELVADDGNRYDLGYEAVDYPHIAPHHLYRPARARVRALDVQVADVRVGYVRGVGDGVPEALDQLGVDWETIGEAELANGSLGRFDVIITGARAYEVRDDLVAHNQRVLDWARAGGTLIVQYNKYPALGRDYAPWPVTIARPHGRVTDETAPVTILEPGHAALTTPNAIGPADWAGWVQERGLYFWETWDGPLAPLLAMGDPGEEPLTGSLLVGPLGQGTYVYTGLALFRQLPEGVPGAYRLLANLISLGADR